MLLHFTWHYGTFCCEDVITFYPTELRDGEQEDYGQDSPDTHKDNIYDSDIHIGLSGVCHCVFVCQHVYLKGWFVLKVIGDHSSHSLHCWVVK